MSGATSESGRPLSSSNEGAPALLLENVGTLCTMVSTDDDPLGRVESASVVVEAGRISFAGPSTSLEASTRDRIVASPGARVVDVGGAAVLPGLIDVHTHAIFAGDRADEFALRARGATYAEIMAAGGGIRSTTAAVRAASQAELEDASRPRLRCLLEGGVTTCEVKSGYGLSLEHEAKTLRAAKSLAQEQAGPDLVRTFLGAHAVPPEFEGRTDAYVDSVVEDMLPAIVDEGLAERCDIFIERGAFSIEHGRRVLGAARDLGLDLVAHVEQLSRSNGAALAAELGVRSVSHLEFVNAEDIKALADAGVIAEVLASAQVFLGMKERIDGRALADAGCPIAIGTDLNPGSAFVCSLPLAAGLAVTNAGLTAEEALLGMTAVAARALNRPDRGLVVEGMRADLLVLDCASPYALVYEWGVAHTRLVTRAGRIVFDANA